MRKREDYSNKKISGKYETEKGSSPMGRKKAFITFLLFVIFSLVFAIVFTNTIFGDDSNSLDTKDLGSKIKSGFNDSSLSKALGIKVIDNDEDLKDKENTSNDSNSVKKEDSNLSRIQPNGRLENIEVIKVVDGDTINVLIDGRKDRVRLIGIDTPESVHPDKKKNTKSGKVASEYTKNALSGKKVDLEFDVQTRDRYGRLLAYVYVDSKSLNEMLINDGMAVSKSYPPNVKNYEKYKKLERIARDKEIGIWKR